MAPDQHSTLRPPDKSAEVSTDVLILGGGTGGVAAALALARAGISCIITESTSMLGGQLTNQGVPPDEHPWVDGRGPGAPESFTGVNHSYSVFRQRIRAWYQRAESLTDAAANNPKLNPGGGWVSRLCFEPRIGHKVLLSMLAEADGNRGIIRPMLRTTLLSAQTEQDRITAVKVSSPQGEVVIKARLILEATELGDLYESASVEHAFGAESVSVYGELHARNDLPAGKTHDPLDQQACTWCFAVEHHQHDDHTIAKPASYQHWRTVVPDMRPPWTGNLFSWRVPSHNVAGHVDLPLVPHPDSPSPQQLELWRYRRIVDASVHTDSRRDVSLFNVVQMDYFALPLIGVDSSARDRALLEARQQSLCFLYWMQTEAPRHDTDDRTGYPGLKLSGHALVSGDGFALAPYIREPRRLLARTMLTEAHVGYDQRVMSGIHMPDTAPKGMGEQFTDSVAIGHYPIDLHPSCAGRNSVYVPACPFRVPLGALLPVRVRNLIAAGKALGVSHVANGATRLHPVEWAIGESAGTLAALCISHGWEPHQVADHPAHIGTLQSCLREADIPLHWPWEDSL